MILEGIVTTLDAEGRLNVAPMGPVVEPDMSRLLLRPFQTSQTYRNLRQRPCGVLHVVDDVLLIARAAIGRLDQAPETFPAERIAGRVLRSACRWYEFEIESLDDSRERTEIAARVVHAGRLRDVFGFNRAKHAVLEAAILATRLHLLPRDEVLRQFSALRIPVEKTAGPPESEAFSLLESFVREHEGVEQRGIAGACASVRIRTGARLHFGPLAVGAASGREFGGVGMMIDAPGFDVTARRLPNGAEDDVIEAPPAHIEAARKALARYRDSSKDSDPRRSAPRGLSIEAAIPSHAGLGSGTQFALAVGRALAELDGESAMDAGTLARRVGRGARSAVGIHGFDRGGLLLDGGKRAADAVGTLVARIDVPDWPIVLIMPPDAPGLSGTEESQAFSQLPAMPSSVTERLCRIALLEMLPAFQDGDFRAASRGLGEYGRVVGEYFAPAQGGVYAHPRMRELAPRLRAEGYGGVGQTSWGPSLFVLAETDTAAERLHRLLASDPAAAGCRVMTTRPLNRGARIDRGG